MPARRRQAILPVLHPLNFVLTSRHTTKKKSKLKFFPADPRRSSLKKFTDDAKSIVILRAAPLFHAARRISPAFLCDLCVSAVIFLPFLLTLNCQLSTESRKASPHTSPQSPPKAPYQSHPKGTLPETTHPAPY